MFCEKCGAKLNDGAKFCSECGAEIQSSMPAKAVAPCEEGLATKKETVVSQQDFGGGNKARSMISALGYILVAIMSIVAFFIPLQTTSKKDINGFDVMGYSAIESWWGDPAIIACVGMWVLFLVSLTCVVLSVFKIYYRIQKKEESKFIKKIPSFVYWAGLITSYLYFLVGVLTVLMCDSSWEPKTPAFIPFIVQLILYCIYRLAIKEKQRTVADWIGVVGVIASIIGVLLFVGVLIMGLIVDGGFVLYEVQGVVVTTSIVFMLTGVAGIVTQFIISCVKKEKFFETAKLKRVFAVILAVICLGFSVWGFVDCSINQDSYDGGYSNGGDDGDGLVSKYIGLSVYVTSIEPGYSYTYVYCKINNFSGLYGEPTMYRYVQVKAVFKDKYGSILDTDSMYAIDGTWLSYGESKTFYYMVRNLNVASATLSIL